MVALLLYRRFAKGDKNKRRADARRTAILPPEKQMGFAAQNRNFPNKTGARAPEFAILSWFGGVLQPSSNWIWARRMKHKLRPDACGRETPARSTRRPFDLFFDFSRRDFFSSWKGCLLVVRLLPCSRGDGLRRRRSRYLSLKQQICTNSILKIYFQVIGFWNPFLTSTSTIAVSVFRYSSKAFLPVRVRLTHVIRRASSRESEDSFFIDT